jgi:hypothetical protein
MLEQELQAAPTEDIFVSREVPFFDQKENTTESPIVLFGTGAGAQRRIAAKSIGLRDKEHCKFVASKACVACARLGPMAPCARRVRPAAINFNGRECERAR